MKTSACYVLLGLAFLSHDLQADQNVFPGKNWELRAPESLGIQRQKLMELQELVGGRGCVVRHGYLVWTWGDASKTSDVASAFKPVLSTLMLMAVAEGKLASADDNVANFETRLREINRGKDAGITWKHLASQTSGYGLKELPGQAYSYNDYALALYYDTLMAKVFKTNGTDVLRSHLARPLQFEDAYTFDAFGTKDRPGRLALSVRDFSRFGLLYLRGGQWRGQQLLNPKHVRITLDSPIPATTPLTSGEEAQMLPNQRTIGGTRNITPVGPGFYSYNWWLNRTNGQGQRLFVDAPEDTFVASGHGGMRTLWVIPSLDLVVCWNDSNIADHDQSPGNPNTKCNQAARLIHDMCAVGLGTTNGKFTLNGQPAFLSGCSYYGALGAPEPFIRQDLADMQRYGFNWLRVWANWSAFSNDVSAVDEGRAREPFLGKLRWLLAECTQRGIVVDVTLSRGNGVTGPARLQTHAVHLRAVETLVNDLKPWGNWYLDLSNERNIRDKRFTSFEELADLRKLARKIDPNRLVTASQGGDIELDELREYLQHVKVDFISPHRPRDMKSLRQTAAKTTEYRKWMEELGHIVPVHYQEPFRRGYGTWEPVAEDFLADARQARQAGAAGWCFHNGDARKGPGGQPRRSFDMSKKRLFDQLDTEEQKFLEQFRKLVDAEERR